MERTSCVLLTSMYAEITGFCLLDQCGKCNVLCKIDIFFQKNTPDNKKDENYLTGNYCCVVDVLELYLKKIAMMVSNQKTRKMI